MAIDIPIPLLSHYKIAHFRNQGPTQPRSECIEAGIPEYVRLVVDPQFLQKRAICFGLRLPQEQVADGLLILRNLTLDVMADPQQLGDEIIQQISDDEVPELSIGMGESLVQALDAALGVLKGQVLLSEINNDYPLASI